MQCYTCGGELSSLQEKCPACGRPRSKLIYVHFCGVVVGIIGSLIGFTLFNDMVSAVIGGLLGIVLAELGGRMLFRPRVS